MLQTKQICYCALYQKEQSLNYITYLQSDFLSILVCHAPNTRPSFPHSKNFSRTSSLCTALTVNPPVNSLSLANSLSLSNSPSVFPVLSVIETGIYWTYAGNESYSFY